MRWTGRWGVAGRNGVRLTPAALRALAKEGVEKSFAKAADGLGRLAGVAVTAERAAKQTGREIAAWDGRRRRRGTVPERHLHRQRVARLGAAVGGRARPAQGRHGALRGVGGEGLPGTLRRTRVADVLRELRVYAGEPAADKAARYFESNRGRIRYPLHRDMGLLIGSGMVESSCGTLVGTRFKRGGMRWSKAGANDVLPLRASIRGGLYDRFWRQRRGPPTLPAERLAHYNVAHPTGCFAAPEDPWSGSVCQAPDAGRLCKGCR